MVVAPHHDWRDIRAAGGRLTKRGDFDLEAAPHRPDATEVVVHRMPDAHVRPGDVKAARPIGPRGVDTPQAGAERPVGVLLDRHRFQRGPIRGQRQQARR